MVSILLALWVAGPPPIRNEQDAVEALLARFEAAWNSGDLDTMVATYTDPHVDANHPKQVLTHDETHSMLERLGPGRRHTLRIVSDEVVVVGDHAFQRGSFVLTPVPEVAAEGGEILAKRYIEILRRGEDGTWRVWWSMDGPVVP